MPVVNFKRFGDDFYTADLAFEYIGWMQQRKEIAGVVACARAIALA